MKPIVKIGTWFWFPKGVIGMTLFPFIFVDKAYYMRVSKLCNESLIRHETIHFRQQMEMLVILFYLWYGLEYLAKLIPYGKEAYNNISFEREAYMCDMDITYLKNRKFWEFLKYV
jgi:hypothetical protein